MALGKKGLGRGFESLIPTDLVAEEFDPTRKEDKKMSKLVELEITEVVRDEGQPRKNFDKAALEELASSIKEHGVLQPIVVVKQGGKYQIVAGERRWRASQLAGKTTIPAIVRTLDAQNKLELSIIENAQREDLNAIELATAYAKLKEQFNLTNEEIGKRVGKSAASVVNTMRLLKLPDEAKKAMQEHHLMEGPMRPLISLDREKVLEILPKMIDEGWSARKVEQYIAGSKPKSSAGAIKSNEYLKEEGKLAEEYGVMVKIRGRSVTFSARSDEEFKALLKKL
jgi:ParB family chromosome partitioning protein